MAIACRSSTPNIRIFYRFVLQKRKKHCPIVGKKMLNPNFCLYKKRNVKNTCVTNFSRVERKRYKLCSDAIAARGRQERGGNASLSAPCTLKSSRGQCQSSSRLSRFKTRGTKRDDAMEQKCHRHFQVPVCAKKGVRVGATAQW